MTDELARARAALRLLDASALEGLRQQDAARVQGRYDSPEALAAFERFAPGDVGVSAR